MNQTKKLTQGAMMLAIIGALILIDRTMAYFFTELIVLMIPIVIIMYSTIHSLKDGLILSVGVTILSFLLGNFQFIYLIYVPVGILTGIIYSFGIKRNLDKRTLMFLAITAYVFGEIVATFIVYPLLGFPVATMIEEYRLALSQSGGMVGFNYEQMFNMAGLDFGKMIVIIYIISTLLMGAMEGVLIHLIAVFLLKRFKIKDLGNINIFDIKPNPLLCYICFAFLFSLYFIRGLENETLYYVIVSLAIVSGMVLLYYGYIFVILFGVMVLHRNIGSLFILLAFFIPGLLVVLMILGFLYGTGPLRRYLERRIKRES